MANAVYCLMGGFKHMPVPLFLYGKSSIPNFTVESMFLIYPPVTKLTGKKFVKFIPQ
jgi:hypothetical protein